MLLRHLGTGLLATALGTALPAQALAVSSVNPGPNSHADAAAEITLVFDQAIDPATLPGTVHVFGRWSGVVPGQLTVDATGTTVTFQPDRPYFVAETVSVSVSSALLASDGDPLTGGFTSTFWTKPLPGSGTFSLSTIMPMRRIGEGGIRTYGVFAGDVDGDGSPDICAASEDSGDLRLLPNDGCGSFGPMTVHPMPGTRPSPQEGADLNGDGLLDIVTGNAAGTSISVLLGDGSGGFASTTTSPTGGYTHGVGCVDADGDGDMDVVAPNRSNVLVFLNDGAGNLGAPSAIDAGNGEDNVAVADANGDGIADLFVGNYSGSDVAILLGDGAGSFAASSSLACGGQPWSIAAGDVNGDGLTDAVTANWITNTVGILLGDGTGKFSSATTLVTGQTPTAIDLGDLDGDGDLDMVVAAYVSSNYWIYWNNGSGTFSAPVNLPSTSAGSCSTLVDFDRDGDVDIIAADEEADELRLYVQDGPAYAGTQPPSCSATLRVNGWAGRSGWGSSNAQVVRLDSVMHLGITAAPDSPFAILLGFARPTALAIPHGLFHLQATLPVYVLVNGYAGAPAGIADGNGEANFPVPIPDYLPTGIPVTFQALVRDWTNPIGNTLTNAEIVEFQ